MPHSLALASLGLALSMTGIALAMARVGRFALDETGVEITTVYGRTRRITFADIERVAWIPGRLVLHLWNEPPLALGRGPTCCQLGTAWLVLCLMRKVPTSIWHRVLGVPRTSERSYAAFDVVRTFRLDGETIAADRGITMRWLDVLAYVPTTTTEVRGRSRMLANVLQGSHHPDPSELPIANIARVLLTSSLPHARQVDLWRDIAHQCGGTVRCDGFERDAVVTTLVVDLD